MPEDSVLKFHKPDREVPRPSEHIQVLRKNIRISAILCTDFEPNEAMAIQLQLAGAWFSASPAID
jgi:hypothetical protein